LAEFRTKVLDEFSIDISKGELDLLVGGPPCQGYSGIGHRRSYAVDKKHIPSNHLYEDMLFLIDRLRPKIFLFENVRGLLSARWAKGEPKGGIWEQIRKEFKDYLGENYYMGWHLVRAREYGVPQNRPRVLMAGIRKNLGWIPSASSLDEDGLLIHSEEHRAGGLIPRPKGEPPSPLELLGDLVDPSYEPGKKETPAYPRKAAAPANGKRKSIQQILRTSKDGKTVAAKGDELTEQEYSQHRQQIVDKFRHMIRTGGEIRAEDQTKKFAQRVLPRQWPNGEPTITATSLPDDYVHFHDPRILTVREWARLQMFPDWYQFEGKRTTGGLRRAGNPLENVFDREVPKYTQIGNAVPVTLAEALGRNFKKILNKAER
jgi:DNA (cytosine-5)-methyltransferase 1